MELVLHEYANGYKLHDFLFFYFNQTFEILLSYPLQKLYLKGPNPLGLGFWAGKPAQDICSTITGSPSYFWETHINECLNIISTHFESFMLTISILMYIIFLFMIFCGVISNSFNMSVGIFSFIPFVVNSCIHKTTTEQEDNGYQNCTQNHFGRRHTNYEEGG